MSATQSAHAWLGGVVDGELATRGRVRLDRTVLVAASSGIEDRLAKDGTGMGQHSTDEGRESVPGSAPPHKSKVTGRESAPYRKRNEGRDWRRRDRSARELVIMPRSCCI